MFGTEGFDLWWLIPIVLIALCFFGTRGCCFGRRHCREIDDEEYEEKEKNNHPDLKRRAEMTTESTGHTYGREEKCAAMDCCSPERFTEMMSKCGDDMKRQCGAMMQEMMKRGCCQPEEK